MSCLTSRWNGPLSIVAAPCAPWHCVRGLVRNGGRGRPFNGIVRHRPMNVGQLTIALLMTSMSWSAMCACPDGNWWSIEQEARDSKFVFVGTPVAEWPGVGDRSHWIEGTIFRLRVERVIGGTPLALVDLFSEESSGRFPMEKGISYLVFASSCGGRLYAYAKGNSGMLAESRDSLRQAIKIRGER